MVRFDWDEDVLYYGGVEFDNVHVKKCLLAACGGQFTETYFKMLDMDIQTLYEHLNLYAEYSKEQNDMINQK